MTTINMDTELFRVTRYYNTKEYVVVMTFKELQCEFTKSFSRNISKIEKIHMTIGEEVDYTYFKPKKYKDKPWSYAEKYGVSR